MPAGYSGTPLARKLGIKPGHTVATIDAPDDLDELLAPLPDGVLLRRDIRGAADVVLAFFISAAALNRRLPAIARRIRPDRSAWLCWPKKGSGVETDLTGDVVRAVGLDAGLVDIKVAAVSETWSGLKFVVPVADR